MKIEVVNRAVLGFLREVLKKEGTIIKTSKTSEGWEVQVEVIEESAYMKALGIPARVMDRNFYEAKLSEDLDVVSFERVGQPMVTRRAS
ncbi:MAG: gas vesicle protein [candidate division NC10 bacterium]|nr:gas vesicle protein [candidate division NC10 bacterium]